MLANHRKEQVYLGDYRITLVLGKGKILLKLTSRRLALSNVLHVSLLELICSL